MIFFGGRCHVTLFKQIVEIELVVAAAVAIPELSAASLPPLLFAVIGVMSTTFPPGPQLCPACGYQDDQEEDNNCPIIHIVRECFEVRRE